MGVLEIDTADYVTLNLAVIDSGLIDLCGRGTIPRG